MFVFTQTRLLSVFKKIYINNNNYFLLVTLNNVKALHFHLFTTQVFSLICMTRPIFSVDVYKCVSLTSPLTYSQISRPFNKNWNVENKADFLFLQPESDAAIFVW